MNTVTYIAHGGGPLPLLGDAGHSEMLRSLQQLSVSIRKPDAIIVISAHWEEDQPTITSGVSPSIIYDYSGFPPESYKIQYPAPGAPALAEEIYALLDKAELGPLLDADRGFDHGLFVPLKIIYPEAGIPCLQLSLLNTLDPEEHIKIGETLAAMEDKNLLIVGSGLSFHNMKAFFSPVNQEIEKQNLAFDAWLNEICRNPQLEEQERRHQLVHWESAPGARVCHPREEHLLPLHVCYGLKKKAATSATSIRVMGRKVSNFVWL